MHSLLPLPVPASIYGLVLMLIGLQTGILPLSAVNEAGGFLIEIMPMLFIPAGVGLMVSWGALKPVILPISIIIVVTTILVMGVSGRIAQFILKEERIRNMSKILQDSSIFLSGDQPDRI